jgi:importin subunit alpha-6/7
VKKALWTISNIAAGTDAQRQAVFDAGLLHPLVRALQTEAVRQEACWALSNMVALGTASQAQEAVNAGCVVPLCEVLRSTDSNTLMSVLDALDKLAEMPSIPRETLASHCTAMLKEIAANNSGDDGDDRIASRAESLLERLS